MKIITSIRELTDVRATLPSPVGLVPTMGFLHNGHLALVRKAREQCATVITTIFVNPAQFAQDEDFDSYPNDLERDIDLFKSAGTDILWLPGNDEMYSGNFQTWVEVIKLTQKLEGLHRPEHFKGVTTIVAKLFNAVRPDNAYFGQKDAQQARVIQQMVIDLNYPIEITICSIYRESDGLAMSSRNVLLNEQERYAANVLSASLVTVEQAFKSGEYDSQKLRQLILQKLKSEPLAKVDYISISNLDTLEEIHGTVERALVSMAVYFGKTRLIDNVIIG